MKQWGRSRSAPPGLLRSAARISARQCHEFFQIFHRSTDLRGRVVDADLRGGTAIAAGVADLGISGSGAADGGGARAISGRQSQGHCRDGIDADRGADQRRRGHALYEQPGHHRRVDDAQRHLPARHRSRQGAATGAEPGGAGRAAIAQRGPHPRHHHHQERARPHHGGASAVAERPLRHDVFAQLRRAQRQGPAGADRRRRPGAVVRLRRLFDAGLARSAEGRRTRAFGLRRGARDPRPERAGGGRRGRRFAERNRARSATLDQRAGTAADRGGVRRDHRQERRQWRSHAAARHRPHRARCGGLFAAFAAGQQVRGRGSDLPVAGLERDPDFGQRPQDDGRAEAEHA